MKNARKPLAFILVILLALSGCLHNDDAPPPPPPSNDAGLASLSLSDGTLTPAFDTGVNAYSATVDNTVSSITVTASTSDSAASITVNGAASAALDLAVGVNTITVLVTAEDGSTTSTYTIDVTRDVPPPSTNANLSALSLSGITLDQTFDTALLSYSADVIFTVNSTTVTATLEDSTATLTVNGTTLASGVESGSISLNEGSNVLTIVTTAEDGTTTLSYNITIAREAGSGFAQRAYIKASNPDGGTCASTTSCGDRFGTAVAISGNTLVVGAPFEDSGVLDDQSDNSLSGSGAAYVFTRDAAGTWSQQAYLKASNFIQESNYGLIYLFGSAVAISGDTLAVGSPGEGSFSTGVNGDETNCCDTTGISAGAVYVFTRNNVGVWTQQAYVKASNTSPNMRYGATLALEGDTLVVGDSREHGLSSGINGDDSNLTGGSVGAVYVYTRDNANLWSQHSYIKASNAGGSSFFGASIGLSGNTLAVGAPGEAGGSTGINGSQSASSSFRNSGAAYIFTLSATDVWSQQAYIKASNTNAGDGFGGGVALDGDTLIVGAVNESSSATGINGTQGSNATSRSGAAYVFTRDTSGAWSQQAYIKTSINMVGYAFPNTLSLSGDIFAAGVDGDRMTSTGVNADQTACCLQSQAGAAYRFIRDAAGNWSQLDYIKASNTGNLDRFSVVALDANGTLAVGAITESSAAAGVDADQTNDDAYQAGAVYIFD